MNLEEQTEHARRPTPVSVSGGPGQECISGVMRCSGLVSGALPLPPGRRKARPPSGATPRPSPGAIGMSPLPIGSPGNGTASQASLCQEGTLRWLRRRQRPGRLPRLVVRHGDDCFGGNVIIALVTGRCNSDVVAGGCDRAGWGARVRGRAVGAVGGRPGRCRLCGGAGHRQDDGVAGGGRAGAGLLGRGAVRAPG